ncbi:phosphate/phosphite/phosphonate ABC transporter substrate-binding protein [Aquabacterium sp.]|uniref:phosphate/phosphite/phosphonate ABC transporter substrate-binding protein n=1 Tax=Aquabacterium sp. TaxID=1872578 RepID=UPI0037835A1D
MKRRAWLAALPGLAGAALPAWAGEPALVFGLITPRDVERTLASWRPFLQRLGTQLGRPIDPWAAEAPERLVEAFRAGRIDLAWVGNAQALDIVESGAGEVFAQMVTADGRIGYESILVTHRDSPLQRLDDVLRPGRTLVFGDGELRSTSGHLVPLYYAFVKHGINEPQALFRAVRRGSHRQNLLRAAQRELDVATANNEELSLFAAEQPALAAQLRVIWRSPPIPQSPLVWKLALPLPWRKRIHDAIVGFGQHDAGERALLRGVNGLSGFRSSRNHQLVTVADVEMFAAWQQVNNDAALSADDKRARIAAISARASRLELRLKRETAGL